MVRGHRQLGLPEHVLVVLAQPRAAVHQAVVLQCVQHRQHIVVAQLHVGDLLRSWFRLGPSLTLMHKTSTVSTSSSRSSTLLSCCTVDFG